MTKEILHNKLTEIIQSITRYMNLDCRIEVFEDSRDGKTLFVSVYAPENARFLIGKNGQNLKALEHVVRMAFIRDAKESTCSIVVDVNDYRKSRAVQALDVARQAATRVRSTQKAEALIPMSSYERRMIHMELASSPDLSTESIGEEPQRRVVIKPFP